MVVSSDLTNTFTEKLTCEQPHWYVMRDLKRSNAKLPAYQMLDKRQIKVFTPMVWKLTIERGKRIRKHVPFMQSLLFVYATRQVIDPIVEVVDTFQYRFLRHTNRVPMTVRDEDMDRFIKAVESADNPCYYIPEEITPNMIGRHVRIVGGPLDGYEGLLQKIQGSRIKRLFIDLPSLLTVSVEVQPEYIQLLK